MIIKRDIREMVLVIKYFVTMATVYHWKRSIDIAGAAIIEISRQRSGSYCEKEIIFAIT